MFTFLLVTFCCNLSFSVAKFSTLLFFGEELSFSTDLLLTRFACVRLFKHMYTLFLLGTNSTFPPQNVTIIPCLTFRIAFVIKRAFSSPLALITQLLTGPLSVSIMQVKRSKYEVIGSLIASLILEPEIDRQSII